MDSSAQHNSQYQQSNRSITGYDYSDAIKKINQLRTSLQHKADIDEEDSWVRKSFIDQKTLKANPVLSKIGVFPTRILIDRREAYMKYILRGVNEAVASNDNFDGILSSLPVIGGALGLLKKLFGKIAKILKGTVKALGRGLKKLLKRGLRLGRKVARKVGKPLKKAKAKLKKLMKKVGKKLPKKIKKLKPKPKVKIKTKVPTKLKRAKLKAPKEIEIKKAKRKAKVRAKELKEKPKVKEEKVKIEKAKQKAKVKKLKPSKKNIKDAIKALEKRSTLKTALTKIGKGFVKLGSKAARAIPGVGAALVGAIELYYLRDDLQAIQALKENNLIDEQTEADLKKLAYGSSIAAVTTEAGTNLAVTAGGLATGGLVSLGGGVAGIIAGELSRSEAGKLIAGSEEKRDELLGIIEQGHELLDAGYELKNDIELDKAVIDLLNRVNEKPEVKMTPQEIDEQMFDIKAKYLPSQAITKINEPVTSTPINQPKVVQQTLLPRRDINVNKSEDIGISKIPNIKASTTLNRQPQQTITYDYSIPIKSSSRTINTMNDGLSI